MVTGRAFAETNTIKNGGSRHEDGISHAEAIKKLQNPQSRTPAEQAQLERETQSYGAG